MSVDARAYARDAAWYLAVSSHAAPSPVHADGDAGEFVTSFLNSFSARSGSCRPGLTGLVRRRHALLSDDDDGGGAATDIEG